MSMSVFKTMKLVPLTVKTLHHRIIRNTVMGPRRQPLIINRSYSTTPTGRTKKPWTDAMNVLYNRISSLADQRITISLFLNQWVLERQPVNKNQLREFIKELRFHKRYAHALEISTWMTDSGYFELASQDVTVQLDLISKVHGIEQAQKLFNNTPQHLKVLKVYSALLNCYAKAKLVEKAESVVQEMKSLGFANTLLVYNVILNFYYQTGNPEKINSLMQEMEQNGIGCDKFAHSIQLSAYASVSDIVGIEKTLAKMESDPNVFLDWTSYTAAAKGYIKVGLVDKALEMLEKSERLVTGKRRGTAYDSLITLYAATGKTNEVLRIWELYKKNEKVYKEAYISIITSLLKLDDFENAEKIFEEWEFQNHSCYDIHIPNFLIDAYSRKGLVEKAERLIDRAISEGGEPNAKTWYHLATGYLQNGQTLKAVEAMKKAVVVSGRMWKPSNEILANCLGYLKVEGDLGKLMNFMDLLRDNYIISLDIQERLLNHIKNANLLVSSDLVHDQATSCRFAGAIEAKLKPEIVTAIADQIEPQQRKISDTIPGNFMKWFVSELARKQMHFMIHSCYWYSLQQMNLLRLAYVSSTISRLNPKNVVGIRFFYSKIQNPRSREPPWKGPFTRLSRRLSRIRDHNVSVIPVLDKWIQEGETIWEDLIHALIKELRHYRRYHHALEISMWMTDKRYLALTSRAVAVRLDLISKVHGIEQVENYFNNIPTKLKGLESYGALLNCYAYVKSVEKAEAVMQRMRELGFARKPLIFTVMLNLYYKTGNTEKLDPLMREMEENGIAFDKFAYCIRLSSYAAASDIEGMEKTLKRIESDPNVVLDWATYATVANGYSKVGLLDKALEKLKRCERLITGERRSTPYDYLMTQYATTGTKEDVLRVWELHRKHVGNRTNISVITSLLKFDDLESAEKIFEEWESQKLCGDIIIPNFLVDAYSRKGLLEKAEMLLQRTISNGTKPNANTWYLLAKGYLQHNQTPKAVEAMKEMIVLSGPRSRPSTVSWVACLQHLKDSGDMDNAEGFINLLREKDIISIDIQDKLLSYIKDRDSRLDALSALKGSSLHGISVTHGIPRPDQAQKDSSDSVSG
ncbi:uncharacterized protein LOC133677567 [Populus nigra]|uniref:uncharacterized protein LOC133677567 n=1 Tax=Populus nigra TaxID=3691 RepID=UPI002B277801|nr:uncharacterized protein LOC133677567 [Populus nigra]